MVDIPYHLKSRGRTDAPSRSVLKQNPPRPAPRRARLLLLFGPENYESHVTLVVLFNNPKVINIL